MAGAVLRHLILLGRFAGVRAFVGRSRRVHGPARCRRARRWRPRSGNSRCRCRRPALDCHCHVHRARGRQTEPDRRHLRRRRQRGEAAAASGRTCRVCAGAARAAASSSACNPERSAQRLRRCSPVVLLRHGGRCGVASVLCPGEPALRRVGVAGRRYAERRGHTEHRHSIAGHGWPDQRSRGRAVAWSSTVRLVVSTRWSALRLAGCAEVEAAAWRLRGIDVSSARTGIADLCGGWRRPGMGRDGRSLRSARHPAVRPLVVKPQANFEGYGTAWQAGPVEGAVSLGFGAAW